MKFTRSYYLLALVAALFAVVPLSHAQELPENEIEEDRVGNLRSLARAGVYKVQISTNPSVACADMTISAKVTTQSNKVVDTYVKFDLQGNGGRFRANKKTNSQGVASFSFKAGSKSLKDGDTLSCSVQVQNPSRASGWQTVACPGVPVCKQQK